MRGPAERLRPATSLVRSVNVGLVVYPGVDELDVAGPLAVFAAARTIATPSRSKPVNFDVFALAETLDMVEGSGGLKFLPTDLPATTPGLDVLLVPGAAVDPPAERVEALVSLVHEFSRDAQLIGASGSGVFLLARAGLLKGKRATCHPEALADLKRFDATVPVKAKVVADGKVVTSAGRSASIDLGLEVVRRLASKELADLVARRLNHVAVE